jgi:hypothetical protein
MGKQIYHHYSKWEDYNAGMWRKVSKKQSMGFLDDAIRFTGDHVLYGEWMLKVIDQWPNACEQNLSDIDQNRKAWIGHAACCLHLGCPESVTRMAWAYLTKQQQDDANKSAEIAIKKWEEKTKFRETNA